MRQTELRLPRKQPRPRASRYACAWYSPADAEWNPVSAVTAAARQLFGNPNPAATVDAWPLQHPVVASVLWSLALLAVFAPLATWLYRTRTAD